MESLNFSITEGWRIWMLQYIEEYKYKMKCKDVHSFLCWKLLKETEKIIQNKNKIICW